MEGVARAISFHTRPSDDPSTFSSTTRMKPAMLALKHPTKLLKLFFVMLFKETCHLSSRVSGTMLLTVSAAGAENSTFISPFADAVLYDKVDCWRLPFL